jgi:hypothetical protein
MKVGMVVHLATAHPLQFPKVSAGHLMLQSVTIWFLHS